MSEVIVYKCIRRKTHQAIKIPRNCSNCNSTNVITIANIGTNNRVLRCLSCNFEKQLPQLKRKLNKKVK